MFLTPLIVVVLVILACVVILAAAPSGGSVIEVASGPVVITRSCRIVIPPGTVLEDADGGGVLRIAASDVEVEFADGSVLAGAPAGRDPDQYRGCGIRAVGVRNVTVRGARVRGYWTGLWATRTDGLTLEGVDASDNRRARLGSTPAAEDLGDWLYPHHNDGGEWRKNYGAALCVEDAENVTVRRCRVLHGQNALVLDRLRGAKVYDNDFSFNTGWGVAMWRCARCVVSRNAVDFCVRGYSHRVYNRGQDSAGILLFEQNTENVIAENSGTHGGDGFFSYAGNEALGEVGEHPAEWYRRRGNNDNLLIGNDFSYAPAHGVETTFSFGVRVLDNRLVGNGICGVWGGFSQDLLVAGNTIEGNGEMAYGDERGGVNIDHGSHNRIVRNTFGGNRCSVHLWWTDPKDFADKPWGKANGSSSSDNLVADNTFAGDAVVFHLSGASDVTVGPNTYTECGRRMDAAPEVRVIDDPKARAEAVQVPAHAVLGTTQPVGARPALRGRDKIVMAEWGPWDHASPLVRFLRAGARWATYDLRGMPAAPRVEVLPGTAKGVTASLQEGDDGAWVLAVEVAAGAKPGAHPYVLRLRAGDFGCDVRGALLVAAWDATFFNWTAETDPRQNPDGYRRLADGPGAVKAHLEHLVLKYDDAGPDDLGLADAVAAAGIGRDHLGVVARTRVPLAKGAWRFVVTGNDGVRVTVDGKVVVESWQAWRRLARSGGAFELDKDRTVEIVVEHFEIGGHVALGLEMVPGP